MKLKLLLAGLFICASAFAQAPPHGGCATSAAQVSIPGIGNYGCVNNLWTLISPIAPYYPAGRILTNAGAPVNPCTTIGDRYTNTLTQAESYCGTDMVWHPTIGTAFAASDPSTAPYSPGIVGDPLKGPNLTFQGVIYTCAGATGSVCTYAANPAGLPVQSNQTVTCNNSGGVAAPAGCTPSQTRSVLGLGALAIQDNPTSPQIVTGLGYTPLPPASPAMTGTPTLNATPLGPYVVTPTVTGDGTLNPGTGALAVSKIAGQTPGTLFPLSATNTPLLGNPTIGGNKISGVRVSSLPSSCVAGTDPTVTFDSGGIDAGYYCDNTGHYALPPGGSTSVLTQTPAAYGAAGAAGSNAVTGPSQSEPLASPSGNLTPYIYLAPSASGISQTDKNREELNLGDYLKPGTYKPTRYSAPLNNGSSFVSTVGGSPNVTCPTGCSFSAADVGTNVTIYSLNANGDAFDSTILSVTDSMHAVLTSNADITDSGRWMEFGGDDLTPQFTQFFNDLVSTGKCGVIPSIAAGNSVSTLGYLYKGTGFTGTHRPCLRGEGQYNSLIYLSSTANLYNGNDFIYSESFSAFQVIGGANSLRNIFTGNNVVNGHIAVNSVYARDYAASGYSSNSSDQGQFQISGNTFFGRATSKSIGIAVSGADTGIIEKNLYGRNAYNWKMGGGGKGIKFLHEFCYVNCGWVVPSSIALSDPITIDGVRFGPEGITSTTNRILLADSTASSGSNYFGDTQPIFSASTGFIKFNFLASNIISGSSTGGLNPVFYSYTPNVSQSHLAGTFEGTLPGEAFHLDASVPWINDYTITGNLCGPFLGVETGVGNVLFKKSNKPGFCTDSDQTGKMGLSDPVNTTTPYMTGANPGNSSTLSYVNLNSWSNIGGGSRVQISDPDGGTNAVTYTSASSGSTSFSNSLSVAPTLGKGPIWLTGYVQNGSTGISATSVVLVLLDNVTGLTMQQWNIAASTNWNFFKIRYDLKAQPSGGVTVGFINPTSQSAQSTLNLAEATVTQGQEPPSGNEHIGTLNVDFGQICMSGSNTGTCASHGTGAPTATGMADGSIYYRNDSPFGQYLRQSAAWILPFNCISSGCTINTSGGLTVNRSGGADSFLLFQSNGVANGRINGKASSGLGLYFSNAAGSTDWGAVDGTGFGVGPSTTPLSNPFNVTAAGAVTDVTTNSAINTVASSATPAFNLTLGAYQTNTLTANVTSFTVTGITAGGHWCFDFPQNATGGFTVSGAPATVHGFFTIPGSEAASKHNIQCFSSFGSTTDIYAENAGQTNQ